MSVVRKLFFRSGQTFADPPVARALFNQTEWAWVWLIVRLYLGYLWINAAWPKLSDPKWMSTGEAIKGFWTRAVKVPDPPARPIIAYDWYRDFIEMLLNGGHYVWFAKVIAIGEMAIGIGLVLGAFVGIAAFSGAFMNWHFMMAGTASINPVMIVLSVLLVLAWKTAGWWGLDRWLLPAVGTPWQPGGLPVFSRKHLPRPSLGRRARPGGGLGPTPGGGGLANGGAENR
jgi:thiosulfate dehydrogenase [quinone] large subunit